MAKQIPVLSKPELRGVRGLLRSPVRALFPGRPQRGRVVDATSRGILVALGTPIPCDDAEDPPTRWRYPWRQVFELPYEAGSCPGLVFRDYGEESGSEACRYATNDFEWTDQCYFENVECGAGPSALCGLDTSEYEAPSGVLVRQPLPYMTTLTGTVSRRTIIMLRRRPIMGAGGEECGTSFYVDRPNPACVYCEPPPE